MLTTKRIAIICACIFTCTVFFSCADVKSINIASISAIKTLSEYDNIGYSFTYSYKHYTVPKSIYKGIDTSRNVVPVSLPYNDAALSTFFKADKAVDILFNSLISYFEGISQLSDKELIQYNFSGLVDSIGNSPEILRSTGLKKDQLTAAGKIASVATNEIMGIYRERKLRAIIIKHDSDVVNVTAGLNHVIRILVKNSEDDSLSIISKYARIFLDTGIDKSTKVVMLNNCMSEMMELQNKKIMLVRLNMAIEKIGSDNHALALMLKTSKLTSFASISFIQQNAADIYSTYKQINQLKK